MTQQLHTDSEGRQYIDMTPTWTDILPTWRFMVEQVITRDRQTLGKDPNLVMQNFWTEMKVMAEAADKWNQVCREKNQLESGK